MTKQVQVSGGMGFIGWLALAFIVLKLTGYIGWSWWWVLAPIWIPFGFLLFGFLVCGSVLAGIAWLERR